MDPFLQFLIDQRSKNRTPSLTQRPLAAANSETSHLLRETSARSRLPQVDPSQRKPQSQGAPSFDQSVERGGSSLLSTPQSSLGFSLPATQSEFDGGSRLPEARARSKKVKRPFGVRAGSSDDSYVADVHHSSDSDLSIKSPRLRPGVALLPAIAVAPAPSSAAPRMSCRPTKLKT